MLVSHPFFLYSNFISFRCSADISWNRRNNNEDKRRGSSIFFFLHLLLILPGMRTNIEKDIHKLTEPPTYNRIHLYDKFHLGSYNHHHYHHHHHQLLKNIIICMTMELTKKKSYGKLHRSLSCSAHYAIVDLVAEADREIESWESSM